MGIRSIEERFEEKKIKLKYIDRRLVEMQSGRKFYSDGTYYEDVYKINKTYELHSKASGRPSYGLYNKTTGKYEIKTPFQKGFLEEIDKHKYIEKLKER